MAGIRVVNWNELETAGRSGYYRRRAHREKANKKLERAKNLKPITYNLKPTGGENLK
jgi:hypothetical protein